MTNPEAYGIDLSDNLPSAIIGTAVRYRQAKSQCDEFIAFGGTRV